MSSKMNAEWFSRHLNETISSVDWGDKIAGFMSAVKMVRLTTTSGETRALAVKIIAEGGDRETIEVLGTVREADFYNYVAALATEQRDAFDEVLPRVFFAESDWTKGTKTVIMEDLCFKSGGDSGGGSSGGVVNSSLFFGPKCPANKGKDLTAATASCPGVKAEEVARVSFVALAKIHAKFWRREELQQLTWLFGVRWRKGEWKEGWESVTNRWRMGFGFLRPELEVGALLHSVSPDLLRCLVASAEKLSWENFREETKSTPWTLIHGDFQPKNVLWMGKDKNHRARFLDWDFVGVGSGAQELGHYVIFNLDVAELGKESHKRLVTAYHEELIKINPGLKTEFPFRICWEEFVYGGFRKSVFMLPVVAMIDSDSLPYYLAQMEGFRRMHDIVPEKVGFPRM